MPKQLIYKLKIDGSYERDTIPMQRLSEYMSDLAALLGEPTSVHFADLEAGSAVLAAAIDTAAIPKVMERVTAIGRGEAPDDLRKAFSKIDRKLAEDNAIGSLSAYPDQEAGAVVLDFPGREGQTIDYGLVRQRGSIDGVPVTIGGQEKTAHVILEDRNRIYARINITRDQAKEIAPCLYSKVVRLHGMGSWRRDDDGQWQLERFRVDSFEILQDTPLREVLERVRSMPGSGWTDIDDPMSFLENLQSEPDERPH